MKHVLFTTYGGAVVDLTPTTLQRTFGNQTVKEQPTTVARLLSGREATNAKQRTRETVCTSERLRAYEPQRTRSIDEWFSR